MYRRINFEYYGLHDQEDSDMLKEEESYENNQAEKDLTSWVNENKEYIRMKLKDASHYTKEQLIQLVDDESIEEFKTQHQTSTYYMRFILIIQLLLLVEEALHNKFQASSKDEELRKELEKKKKMLMDRLESTDENTNDPRHMTVEEF